MKKKISALFDATLLKFLLIGGVSTAVDYLIYTMLGHRLPLTPAKLISMLFTTLFAFYINRNWTFQDRKQGLLKSLGKYYLAQMANIATNVLVNALLLNLIGNRTLAFVGATGVAMCVNYILQRLFVFQK